VAPLTTCLTTATHALQYCLWRNKQNTLHKVITMDDLIKKYSNRMYFYATVAEIWSAFLTCLICWKTPFAFLAPLTKILNWRLHCSSRPQELFIDPLAIQWPPFDPVTIYRTLGWSNWLLGVDIDYFENHGRRAFAIRAGLKGRGARGNFYRWATMT